jgi:hypothetical protein
MSAEPFALEAPEPGKVPEGVIEELRRIRTEAKDHVTAFTEAIKVQAAQFGIKPSALRRYVAALADDKIALVTEETDDLERLLAP